MTQHTKMNWVNGGLFVSMNALAALSLGLTGDEAAKFITAIWLFWIKLWLAVLSNAFLAAKTFLSQMKKEEPDTKTDVQITGRTVIEQTTETKQQP
jgi:hypothetical protein